MEKVLTDLNNNPPPLAVVYPVYPASVVIQGENCGRVMKDVRWGMPRPKTLPLEATEKGADGLSR